MLYKINFNGVQSPKLINPATFTDRPHVSKSVYGLQEISRSPSRTLAASTSTISVENAPKIENVEYKVCRMFFCPERVAQQAVHHFECLGVGWNIYSYRDY